jgi:hypothetical protein
MSYGAKKLLIVYIGHYVAISFLIVSALNEWNRWIPLFLVLYSVGLFIYSFWKIEKRTKENMWLWTLGFLLAYQLAALIFIVFKIQEERGKSKR